MLDKKLIQAMKKIIVLFSLVLFSPLHTALGIADNSESPIPLQKTFSDVPLSHPAYSAVQYLASEGIVSGYENGRFEIDKPINRAAALKIILMAADKEIPSGPISTDFADVPSDAWYAPYVHKALEDGIISSGKSFSPDREVNRAEFIKMLLLASGLDVQSYNLDDITLEDVPQDAWFAPYMKFGVKAGVISKDEQGLAHPGEVMTRWHAVRILYLSLAKSPQLLLDLTEAHLLKTITALENKEMQKASFSVIVAEDFSNQALKKLPENPVVSSASKITTSLKNLVGAYTAGDNGRLDDVITACKNAWKLADEAQKINPQQESLAVQIKTLASSMADQAREKKAELETSS